MLENIFKLPLTLRLRAIRKLNKIIPLYKICFHVFLRIKKVKKITEHSNSKDVNLNEITRI